jgi:cell volume regulation protein A
VGLRGAVPIIFSIYALDANLENGPYIFNLVFFISLLSVLLQGSTIPWVASLLGLSVRIAIRKKSAVEAEYLTTIKPVRAELEIRGDSPFIKKSLVSLALPKEILISMMTREEVLFVPDGTTVFQEGDRLTVMTDTEEIMDGFRKQINPG